VGKIELIFRFRSWEGMPCGCLGVHMYVTQRGKREGYEANRIRGGMDSCSKLGGSVQRRLTLTGGGFEGRGYCMGAARLGGGFSLP